MAPRLGCFRMALIGFVFLLLVNVLLFGAVMWRAWQSEQAYRDFRAEFERQRAAWLLQAPSSYSVTYSNCQHLFCCQNARLEVLQGTIEELPTCAANSYGSSYSYYGSAYQNVLSISDAYLWLNDYISQNRRGLKMELSYDPQTAALTEIRWREWGQDYLVRYDNLTPLE